MKWLSVLTLLLQVIMSTRTYVHECFLHEAHVEQVWWPLQFMADAVMHTRNECAIAQQTMVTTFMTMATTFALAWGIMRNP